MAGKAKGEGIVNLERLSNQLNQISEPDKKAASEAKQRWDSVAKPLGSLGLLEDALIRIAALTGSADIDLSVRRLYLMCADNGVVAQNVTQTGSEVTARMADSFAAGKSSACRMAKVANCQVEAVDLGILNYPGNPGVRNCRIANGTADITQKPAMTKAELYRCIETGIGLVKCAKEDRVKYFEFLRNNDSNGLAEWLKDLSTREKERMKNYLEENRQVKTVTFSNKNGAVIATSEIGLLHRGKANADQLTGSGIGRVLEVLSKPNVRKVFAYETENMTKPVTAPFVAKKCGISPDEAAEALEMLTEIHINYLTEVMLDEESSVRMYSLFSDEFFMYALMILKTARLMDENKQHYFNYRGPYNNLWIK